MFHIHVPPHPEAESYHLYYAPEPGAGYVPWPLEIPAHEDRFIALEHDLSLQASLSFQGLLPTIEWQEPWDASAPYTFKAVPIIDNDLLWSPQPDTQVSGGNLPDSGHLIHALDGHQSETYTLNQPLQDPYLIVWLKLHHTPEALWIELSNDSNLGRQVWGLDILEAAGIHRRGGALRRGGRNLPAPHRWNPFIVHTSRLLLSDVGSIGIGIMHRSALAQVELGPVYTTDQPVLGAELSAPGLRHPHPYSIQHRGIDGLSWVDAQSTIDYRLRKIGTDYVDIRWYPPEGATPAYDLRVHLSDGTHSDPLVLQGEYPAIEYTKLFISDEPITDESSVFQHTTKERAYVYALPDPDQLLYVRFKHYSPLNELLAVDDRVLGAASSLNTLPFTLDLSVLA